MHFYTVLWIRINQIKICVLINHVRMVDSETILEICRSTRDFLLLSLIHIIHNNIHKYIINIEALDLAFV